jgi:hypothetical protein
MATTTTTTTFDLTHAVRVVCDGQVDGLGHRAECGCGWASDWCDDPADAEAAGVDHREVAVGPGDGLDRVMSELLDLQDDLADMVVWLAENWSADLPVPIVYGCDGGGDTRGPARVELSTYCVEPADLGRIARLLGVPTVEDESPDCYGSRYLRARRNFGRVSLRAYTSIEPGRGRVS